MSGILFQLKSEFVLDNTEVALIGGASLSGMARSQLSFSALCDVVGMRTLPRAALVGHVAGVMLPVTATGFAGLFGGALVLAIANGAIEALCNPLTAALFPDRKAGMLNCMHLWFPGGVALGGVFVWGLIPERPYASASRTARSSFATRLFTCSGPSMVKWSPSTITESNRSPRYDQPP